MQLGMMHSEDVSEALLSLEPIEMGLCTCSSSPARGKLGTICTSGFGSIFCLPQGIACESNKVPWCMQLKLWDFGEDQALMAREVKHGQHQS